MRQRWTSFELGVSRRVKRREIVAPAFRLLATLYTVHRQTTKECHALNHFTGTILLFCRSSRVAGFSESLVFVQSQSYNDLALRVFETLFTMHEGIKMKRHVVL